MKKIICLLAATIFLVMGIASCQPGAGVEYPVENRLEITQTTTKSTTARPSPEGSSIPDDAGLTPEPPEIEERTNIMEPVTPHPSDPVEQKTPVENNRETNAIPSQPTPGNYNEVLVHRALSEASEISGLAEDSFTIIKAEARQWPDSSLGCPLPGMMYLQVITDGYQIVLKGEGEIYDFRSGSSGKFFLCPNPSS